MINNLFDIEDAILQNANDSCNNDVLKDNILFKPFCKLTKNYKKLLRQTKKLIKISDNQQKMLGETNDKQQELTKEITDSILYAKSIQKAILPSIDFLNQDIADHFLVFKPRDIVSGDFYWATKQNNKLIFAAADCTGHGVPGAFMSMLGITFLNEIVNKEHITSPNEILNELRSQIINSLQQKGIVGEQKDGMDISLCSLDLETMQLSFSGANNPLYIIRNGELLEFKGDKMPIAIYVIMDKFSHKVIDVQKGDIIYMFSDGFADQFGGVKGKKFKYKPFKKLLLENSHLPMKEQQQIVEKTLQEWVSYKDPITHKPYEQLDDIVILSVKI